MTRLFVDARKIAGGAIALEGEVLRHVRTVLRLGTGDLVTVTDGAGAEYRARLERLGRDAGLATILETSAPNRESPLRTVLAQAVPKGDRFPLVLQKAVELGVTEIAPVVSHRAVPLLGRAGEDARLARWRRIVEGAVAQSGRTRVPLVRPPCSWEDFIASADAELRLLFRAEAGSGLRELIAGHPAPQSVILGVGPEGGWSEDEVAHGERRGFVSVRLGPRVLRTETAGIAALVVVQQAWGDLG